MLRPVLIPLLFASQMVLAGMALNRLSRHWQDAEVQDRLVPRIAQLQELDPASIPQVLSDIERDSSQRNLGADGYYAIANLLQRSALEPNFAGDQIKTLCVALENYGRALLSKPQSSTYLANWANLRQTLGKVYCQRPHTGGSFNDAMLLALERDPTNSALIYVSVLMRVLNNPSDVDWKSLRTLLERSPELSQGQQAFITALVKSGDEVEQLIPARFPQAALWSDNFMHMRPDFYRENFRNFVNLQVKAIELNQTELLSGNLPPDLSLSRLESLYKLNPTNRVRQLLDNSASAVLLKLGDQRASAFLKSRASYADLKYVSAFLDEDSRAQKSNLNAWAEHRLVSLDSFYASAGAFVPPGQMVAMLELNALPAASTVDLNLLKVMVSDDNLHWKELALPANSIESAEIFNNQVIRIKLSKLYFKYWKVHFDSASRVGQFRNEADQILKFYGGRE